MKEGNNSFKTIFMGKDSKINRITSLTNKIISADRDIECLSLLHKIIVLQLNQAAIQFFKRDKFTTYNHTVNLYLAKQIENNSIKSDLFQQITNDNQKQLGEYEKRKRDHDSVIIERGRKYDAIRSNIIQTDGDEEESKDFDKTARSKSPLFKDNSNEKVS